MDTLRFFAPFKGMRLRLSLKVSLDVCRDDCAAVPSGCPNLVRQIC